MAVPPAPEELEVPLDPPELLDPLELLDPPELLDPLELLDPPDTPDTPDTLDTLDPVDPVGPPHAVSTPTRSSVNRRLILFVAISKSIPSIHGSMIASRTLNSHCTWPPMRRMVATHCWVERFAIANL